MTDEAKMLRGIIDHLRATMATALDELGVNYDQDASATVLLDELITEAKALHQMLRGQGMNQ